jgi:D-beta-D-heptose 7-phosphate kinase/D-beta-D-heptose 1-phosphate adenosyltransferase
VKTAPRKLLSKVKSPAALQRLLAAAQKKKARTVFTNGCFDLLHKGHVTYLEQARKLGDLLIVAVNSDDSVKRLKGPERPINALADRIEVLAALEAVDFVTWFEEDTPESLIRLLKPRVLVKGGDWKVDQIVGSKDVLSWGGKVRSLPYVQGRSTTQMIEKAKSAHFRS